MRAVKAKGISGDEILKAISSPPRNAPSQAKGPIDKKAPKLEKKHQLDKKIELKIKNPNYSQEQREEILNGSPLASTARIPVALRVMLKKPFILKNPSNPEFSQLDERSLIKLSLFIMNGISDNELAECINIEKSLGENKEVIPLRMSKLFTNDFVRDTLFSRISKIDKKKISERMMSKTVRIGLIMIGRMSEEGTLDDTLIRAKAMQYDYGLNLISS